jgi:hypothetical protein
MTKTFTLRFVPHLPPVEFRVAALNAVAAKREAEGQIRSGQGPIFEEVCARLHEQPDRCGGRHERSPEPRALSVPSGHRSRRRMTQMGHFEEDLRWMG